jgi:hypothetical protein
MPAPKNATIPEFYVYLLEAKGVPFYVGVGRSTRASDRVRYVRWLMKREARGKTVKWTLSNAVVADLLRSGCKISVAYPVTGLVRAAALTQERAEINRLLKKGAVLANIHHNPRRPSGREVTREVLARR